jgi:hypothetical protein
MGLAHSPRIVSDGLVLALDAINTKSFPGITQNIAPFNNYSNRTYGVSIDIGGWNGDDADVIYYASGGYNNLPYKKMTKHTGGTGGSYIDEHSTFTIVNNRNYKISCWMKASTSVTVNQLALCINRSSNNTYFSRGTDIALTTEWTKIEWYWNSGSNASSTYLGRHIVYNDVELPIDIFWCDFRVEPIDENIYDLTGTNAITDYTLAYNANTGLNFNGSTSYISLPLNAIFNTPSVTFDVWCNLQNRSNRHILMVNWQGNSLEVESTGTARMFNFSSSGQLGAASNVAVQWNTWTNVVGTYNDSTNLLSIYVNGNLVGSTSAPSTIYSVGVHKISGNDYGGQILGTVATAKHYNRALTALEVKQNFNATRGRFGV